MAVSALGATLQALRAATLADITAYVGALPGYIARVDSVGRSYIAVTTGTSVADGITYLTGTGVDWQVIAGTSDKKWLAQATWFISNVGSDENSGVDSGHPIATVAEIQRRWGVYPVLLQATTITFLTDNAGGVLQYARGAAAALLTVDGTPTVTTSDTVSAFTAPDTTTNVWMRLTGTLIGDFTPYVNKRINYTSGPASGQTTWVVLQSPQGVGINVAEVNYATGPSNAGNSYSFSTNNPVAGNTFNIETLNTIDRLIIECADAQENISSGASAVINPAILVQNIYVKTIAIRANSRGNRNHLLSRLQTDNWTDTQPATRSGSLQPIGCLFTVQNPRINNANIQYCVFKPAPGITANFGIFTYDPCTLSNCLFEGIGWNPASGSYNVSSTGLFNAPAGAGGALTLSASVSMLVQGFLLGQGNVGTGVVVNSQSQFYYISGIPLKLTGASGDWKFNIAGVFTWAQVPRQMNQMSGTDTLVAGTKTVAVPNLPADARPVVIRNTAGGDPGDLSVPEASKTTAQFVVNSSSATDTSTFNWSWFSQANGPGGVFIA